jgi:hypothetical protein
MAAVRGAGFTPVEIQGLTTQFLRRDLFSNVDYRTFLGMAQLPLGRFTKDSGILRPERLQQTLRMMGWS